MVFGICLLVAIYLLYVLLVKGALWKLVLGGFGMWGIWMWLSQFQAMQVCPLNISGYTISWAAIIPIVIFILVLAHTHTD